MLFSNGNIAFLYIFRFLVSSGILAFPIVFVPYPLLQKSKSCLYGIRPIVWKEKKSFLLGSVGGLGQGPEGKEQATYLANTEPDHELFRRSRLSEFDIKCDDWYESLLGNNETAMFLGDVSLHARQRIRDLVKLKKQPILKHDDDNWTPYQQNLVLTSPIYPSYGLEQFGLPIPRRNAEAWRHFDVPGLIASDYSAKANGIGSELVLDGRTVKRYIDILKAKGVWIDDEKCRGRLIYVNGRFVPSLSKCTDHVKNLCRDDFTGPSSSVTNDILQSMKRLTDGFTDCLAVPVPVGNTEYLTSYKRLSEPDHNVGEPASQFAINGQHGTACFVALNSVRAGAVAFVNIPSDTSMNFEEVKPVLTVNAWTADEDLLHGVTDGKGVAYHPRALVLAGDNSCLSFLQSFVDLDTGNAESNIPKFVNSCTQIYVNCGANVTHSYVEETGVVVTSEGQADSGKKLKRIKSLHHNKSLRSTHFETTDVHIIGDNGLYTGAIMSMGGNDRCRIAVSTSLLCPGSHANINGFCLAGGAQCTEMRSFIHHIAQGTSSQQNQKNMVGGTATTSFRGRIRVEQSAQQTDSKQLACTIHLSEKSKMSTIPSLEIIADDVKCTHGATVSDLSDDELLYLQTRGLDKKTARLILMYAFVDEIASCIYSSFLESKDTLCNMKNRIFERMQLLVPYDEKVIR